MIGVWNGLRALAGDALVAVGTALQEPRSEFDEFIASEYLLTAAQKLEAESEPPGHRTDPAADVRNARPPTPLPQGRMESDGPDAADVLAADCNCELPDSEMLRTAAHIIGRWRSILLRGAGIDYDVDELDDFVDLLRDRAAQFAAVEADEKRPHLTPADLFAADVFPQHRGK